MWSFTKRDRGFELGTTNPASGRVEALNPGSPDYDTSTLNISATLSPYKKNLLSNDNLLVNASAFTEEAKEAEKRYI